MPRVVLHMLHQSFVNLFWRPRRWLARPDESVCIASHLSHFNPTVFCLKHAGWQQREVLCRGSDAVDGKLKECGNKCCSLRLSRASAACGVDHQSWTPPLHLCPQEKRHLPVLLIFCSSKSRAFFSPPPLSREEKESTDEAWESEIAVTLSPQQDWCHPVWLRHTHVGEKKSIFMVTSCGFLYFPRATVRCY